MRPSETPATPELVREPLTGRVVHLLRRIASGAGRRVARGIETLLHPWFRWRARRRLAALATGIDIVVVCHGNICRSPMAEHLLRRQLAARGDGPARIISAGFIGPGRGSPAAAIKAAAAHGVDLTSHRSQTVTRELLANGALLVVMEPAQGLAIRQRFGVPPARIIALGDLDPAGLVPRTIPDPIDRTDAFYAACYTRLVRCSSELTKLLKTASPTDA